MLLAATFSLLSLVHVQGPLAQQGEGVRRADTVLVGIDELVRVATTQNLRARSAAAETQGSATYARSARSRYDPVINIGGKSDGDGIGGQLTGMLPSGASYLLGSVAPSTLPGEPIYPNALVASINQPVLRGLGFYGAKNSIRAVDEGVSASRSRFKRTLDEVTAEVGVAYALLVERHRQEAIALRSLQRAEELHAAYTELRSLSRITEVDLITAQLGVASRRATLLEVRRDRQSAEDALVFAVYGSRASTVLARPNMVVMPRDTAVIVPTLTSIEEATTRALSTRADMVAARHDTERAKFQARSVKNQSLPTVNVSAALTSTKNDVIPGSIGGNESRFNEWSVGLVVSRPLFNTGASAERERAAVSETQADVALAEAENAVRAEVRAAYRDIDMVRQQAALATEASQLARKQYDGERERLKLGLTDIFRVLQFEEQVARVERAETEAWLAYATSVVRYKLAIGG